MQTNLSNFQLLVKLLQTIPDSDACMEWPRSRNKRGYGQLQTWSREREFLVHRQAYILAYGSLPPGNFVLHRCDNPPCFRPSHLFLGDQTDNMRDCAKKQRWKNQSKLTPDDIRAIRQRYQAGALQRVLAEEYGTDQGSISHIVNRRFWRHVD